MQPLKMEPFHYLLLCAGLFAVGVILLLHLSLFGIVFLLLSIHVYYRKLRG